MDGEYYVWFHTASLTSTTPDADDVTLAELGTTPEFDSTGSLIKHTCTFTSCTCQFPLRYGIFCVHIAHLYLAFNITQVPSEILSQGWQKASDARILEARQSQDARLQSSGVQTDIVAGILPDGVHVFRPPTSAPGARIRYQQCLELGRLLAKAAESSPEAYSKILPVLQRSADAVRQLQTTPIYPHTTDQPTTEATHSSTTPNSSPRAADPPILKAGIRKRRVRAFYEPTSRGTSGRGRSGERGQRGGRGRGRGRARTDDHVNQTSPPTTPGHVGSPDSAGSANTSASSVQRGLGVGRGRGNGRGHARGHHVAPSS